MWVLDQKSEPLPLDSSFVAPSRYKRFEQTTQSRTYVKHEWTFTPAVSMFVDCKNENELEKLFKKLSEDGKVFMELGNYGFSRKFSWLKINLVFHGNQICSKNILWFLVTNRSAYTQHATTAKRAVFTRIPT